MKLLATSPTPTGIVGMIREFFYGSTISLTGQDVYNLNGKIEGFAVVLKQGRYRFCKTEEKAALNLKKQGV